MDGKTLGQTVRSFFNVREGRASYETIQKRVRASSRIDGIHVCSLIAAMLIASIGLNLDSIEAVIGAMLICPLMGSVIAIAYAVATVDSDFLRESAAGLAIQMLVCIVTSTFYFALSPLSNATSELLTNSSATVWDVLLALVGGFAGGIGTSRRQEPATLIAGVAVATALMPPLCSVGYGLAMRDPAFALAALYDFLVNAVFIAFGTEMVLVWLRVPPVADLDGDGVTTAEEESIVRRRAQQIHRRLVVGSVVFALPCLFFTARTIRVSIAENGTVFEVRDSYDTEGTTRELAVVCPGFVGYRVGNEDSYDVEAEALEQRIVATVETSEELSVATREEVEALIRINVEDLDSVTFVVAEG